MLFVAADLFVLQTGAHSAGALALASTQARSTSSDERRGILLQLLRHGITIPQILVSTFLW